MSLDLKDYEFIAQYKKIEDKLADMADKLRVTLSLGKKTDVQKKIYEIGLNLCYLSTTDNPNKYQHIQTLIRKLNLYYVPVDINCNRSSSYIDGGLSGLIPDDGGNTTSNNVAQSYILEGSDTNSTYILNHNLNSRYVIVEVQDEFGDIVGTNNTVLDAANVKVEFYAPIGAGKEYRVTITLSLDDSINRITAI